MIRTKLIRFAGVFFFIIGYFYVINLTSIAEEENSYSQFHIYLSILFMVVGVLLFALVDNKVVEALKVTIRVITGRGESEGWGIKIRTFGLF